MKKKQIVTLLIAFVVIIAAAISLPKTAKAEESGGYIQIINKNKTVEKTEYGEDIYVIRKLGYTYKLGVTSTNESDTNVYKWYYYTGYWDDEDVVSWKEVDSDKIKDNTIEDTGYSTISYRCTVNDNDTYYFTLDEPYALSYETLDISIDGKSLEDINLEINDFDACCSAIVEEGKSVTMSVIGLKSEVSSDEGLKYTWRDSLTDSVIEEKGASYTIIMGDNDIAEYSCTAEDEAGNNLEFKFSLRGTDVRGPYIQVDNEAPQYFGREYKSTIYVDRKKDHEYTLGVSLKNASEEEYTYDWYGEGITLSTEDHYTIQKNAYNDSCYCGRIYCVVKNTKTGSEEKYEFYNYYMWSMKLVSITKTESRNGELVNQEVCFYGGEGLLSCDAYIGDDVTITAELTSVYGDVTYKWTKYGETIGSGPSLTVNNIPKSTDQLGSIYFGCLEASDDGGAYFAVDIYLYTKEAPDITSSEAVKTVEDMISALTDSSSESSVQAARNAYNALTADQKKQVSDSAVTKLTNAEKKIAEAKAAADKAAADKAAADKAAAEKAAADKAAAAKAAADKAAADKAAAEKAANITVDGVAVNLASAQTTDQMDKTVTSRKSDSDMSGSLYRTLQAKVSSAGKTSNKVTWKKVSGADGYIVYGSKCGAKNSLAKLKTLSGTSFTQKKLKSGTYYKYMVVAYKNYNGAAKVIATSRTIHVATTGGKVGNPKKVTTLAKKNKVTLKKGKTFKLGAKAVAQSKKLKVKKHRALKYETSNAAVATVSGAGKITAKGKGSCYVYVYAQNGVAAKISVKVK